MDKVETWVNIGAAIISSIFLILNYITKKKSEENAKNSKEETKEIIENAKKELIKISREKSWIQDYSSIDTELRNMKNKLEDLTRADNEILINGIAPNKIIAEVRKSLLNVSEKKHLPGLKGFNFKAFDKKLTEIESVNQSKRIDNVRSLQMMISTQISVISETTDSIK